LGGSGWKLQFDEGLPGADIKNTGDAARLECAAPSLRGAKATKQSSSGKLIWIASLRSQ
jgi:hypothetical protein